MDVRFVVLIDFDADSLEDGYRQLRKEMAKTECGWETADEAFVDGEPIGEQELSQARLKVVAEEEV